MKHLICWFSLALSLACSQALAAVTEDRVVEITVAKADTMINICKKFLEEPGKWQIVSKMNRLADPDLIQPKQKIKVPIDMLKGVPLNATAEFVRGNVTYSLGEKDSWQPLRKKDKLKVGTSIKTGADGFAEIAFTDGTSFSIQETSHLTIKTAKEGPFHLLRKLYLEAGKIISRVKAATGRASRYEIQTPSALAAARGTEYRVAVDPRNTTRAEMLESSIDIKAGGKSIILAAGEGTFVKMNEPPAPPRKLLPPPAVTDLVSLYGAKDLEFHFTKVEKAASYQLRLARDREVKDVVNQAVIRPDESFKIAQLADGTYYLFASSIDADGLEGALSDPKPVKVRTKPLPPAEAAPANNDKLHKLPIRITWNKVGGVAKYHLQVAEDDKFTKIIVDMNGLKDTEYSLTEPRNGSYYYRVSSLTDDGYEGNWSLVRNFNVIHFLPGPMVRQPAVSDKGVSIVWDKLGAGVAYQLQLSKKDSFDDIAVDKKTLQTEVMIDRPKASGTYYVRVRGIVAKVTDGASSGSEQAPGTSAVPEPSLEAVEFEGNWSSPQEFIIINALPAPEILKLESREKEMYFQWENMGDKVTYQLQVAKDSDFSNLFDDEKLPQTEMYIRKPTNPGIYFVRIRAIDPDQRAGDYSLTMTFEVKEPKRFPLELAVIGGNAFIFFALMLLAL